MDTAHSDSPVLRESSGEKGGIRTGLKNKLIWTMLGVGALPLMLAMILSYLQGTKSLQGVIGTSFKALAHSDLPGNIHGPVQHPNFKFRRQFIGMCKGSYSQ